MKTTFSLMAILVFSAIMLKSKIEKPYPPQEVLDQRAIISLKESKLKNVVNTIEYNIVIDSLTIASLKQN